MPADSGAYPERGLVGSSVAESSPGRRRIGRPLWASDAAGPRIRDLGMYFVVLLPAALLVTLALRSGGFFPDAVGAAAVGTICVFSVRALASRKPFAGVSRAVAFVAVALVALAAWTLASGSWSGAASRATYEYDRTLLYAVLFVLVGTVGRSGLRARVLLYGLAAASAGVTIVAAATWLAPDVLPLASAVEHPRLSWPTSYWNVNGMIAALALVWTVGLSCTARVPRLVRVLGTMAAPLSAASLIFTASRGSVVVALVGLALAVATIRSSATPAGLLISAPAVAIAALLAVAVTGLNVAHPPSGALAAGHRTALELATLALAAGAVRAALLRLDSRLYGRVPPWSTTQVLGAASVLAVAVIIAFVGAGGPQIVRRGVHRFLSSAPLNARLSAGQRLLQLGNNGRVAEWKVAFNDGFKRHPLDGTGAGTYQELWTRYAPAPDRVLNAHSLYLEQLSTQGLVGAALLIGAMASMVVAVAARARGPEREAWASLLAGSVMYAIHTGVDWDWQMPAVTAWFFAVGALAMARPSDREQPRTAPGLRVAVGLGCLLLTITPALVWRSQIKLIDGVRGFARGNCVTAEADALASNAALPSRSDTFELIAYCEAGARRYGIALTALDDAEQRDPGNWELRYAQALISAVAFVDPRPAAQEALSMFPTSPLTRAASRAFARGGPVQWRRFALSAALPVQS